MDRWEYLKEEVPCGSFVLELNKLGKEGWEAISVSEEMIEFGNFDRDHFHVVLFKRKSGE